jgi:hypothetical protein
MQILDFVVKENSVTTTWKYAHASEFVSSITGWILSEESILSKVSREKWNSTLYLQYFPVSLKVLKNIKEKNAVYVLTYCHLEQWTMVILTYLSPTPRIKNEAYVLIVVYSEFFFVLIYSMALKHIEQGMCVCVYVCMCMCIYTDTQYPYVF